MNTSADALLEACRKLSYEGTALEQASYVLEEVGESFKGTNGNLCEACVNAKNFMLRMNKDLEKIIWGIENNIEAFAESSKSNESQTLNVLNNVNEQIEAISAELGYK
ncbi:MAG: hypothetical protein Q4E75_00565 [bacterium]|nr:hypothetical protein [bacterium]